MALGITNNRIDGVIVVHLSGAIFFDEESTFLRVQVKDLLDKSRQIVLDQGMSLESIAAGWALLWLSTHRPGRSVVTSSSPTSATT